MNGREILTTAVEGGIGYWSEVVDYKRDKNLFWTEVTLRPAADIVANGEVGDEWPESRRITVTLAMVNAAARRIMRPVPGGTYHVHKDIRAAIAVGDIDAEAADCIVQLACFDQVVYG